MARRERMANIRRRRTRKHSLAKLRKRYTTAKTNDERNKIAAKVRRIAPTVTAENLAAARTAAAS